MGLDHAQEILVDLCIRFPVVHHFIKDQVIRGMHAVCFVDVRLDHFLSAVFVDNPGLHLDGLHTVLDLMLHPLTEALGYTALILVERLVQRDISRCQSCIALLQDVIGSDHAAEGQRAKNDSRCIQLHEFHAGLDVNGGQILLGIFFGILCTFLDCSLTVLHIVDGRNTGLMSSQNIINFQSCFAGHDCTGHGTNGTTDHQNLRAVLADLELCLCCKATDIRHHFVHFHNYLSFLSCSVQRASADG